MKRSRLSQIVNELELKELTHGENESRWASRLQSVRAMNRIGITILALALVGGCGVEPTSLMTARLCWDPTGRY